MTIYVMTPAQQLQRFALQAVSADVAWGELEDLSFLPFLPPPVLLWTNRLSRWCTAGTTTQQQCTCQHGCVYIRP